MHMLIINFDLDDVVYDTAGLINHDLSRIFSRKRTLSDVEMQLSVMVSRKGSSLAFTNALKSMGKPECGDYIWNHILKGGEFIPRIQPRPGFLNLLVNLKTKYKVKLNVCTHRGSFANGVKYTEEALEDNFPGIFDNVYVIDSKKHPDKFKFLDEVCEGEYVLVDDNPAHSDTPIANIPNLIVYGEAHLLPYLHNQENIVMSVTELEKHLYELLDEKDALNGTV